MDSSGWCYDPISQRSGGGEEEEEEEEEETTAKKDTPPATSLAVAIPWPSHSIADTRYNWILITKSLERRKKGKERKGKHELKRRTAKGGKWYSVVSNSSSFFFSSIILRRASRKTLQFAMR